VVVVWEDSAVWRRKIIVNIGGERLWCVLEEDQVVCWRRKIKVCSEMDDHSECWGRRCLVDS
jgi:hypothetical protein